MSVLKASGASLVALLLTWAAAGSVSAKTDPRASAKAAAGAELFSAGIKGKVVQVFAGDGTEASLAKILRDSYAQAIQHLKGHASQDLACHT